MCDCIEKAEKLLAEKMTERYPDWEIVSDVEFVNKSYLIGSGLIILNNPVIGRVKKGKQIRKFDVSIMPSYCPLCGKKLKNQ